MVVTEFYTSREQHITQDGETLTAIWKTTWADWDTNFDGAPAGLPIIGDYWPLRFDLRCTDIKTKTIDNINVEVTALFSTHGFENRMQRTDQIDSWEGNVDVQTEETYADTYHDVISDVQKSWVTAWSDAGGSDSTRPFHVFHDPKATFNITTYGSISYIKRLYDNIGKVNSGLLLKEYSAGKAAANAEYTDDTQTSNDEGQWMLQGCRTQHIRSGTWRFDWTFLHNKIGWQNSIGPGAANIATNEYELYSILDLFEGMDFIEPDFDRNDRA